MLADSQSNDDALADSQSNDVACHLPSASTNEVACHLPSTRREGTTPTATARTTRSPPSPTKVRAHPLHHQVVALVAASTPTVTTAPTTPTATLLRALLFMGLLCCGIASVHSLHDGGVREST